MTSLTLLSCKNGSIGPKPMISLISSSTRRSLSPKGTANGLLRTSSAQMFSTMRRTSFWSPVDWLMARCSASGISSMILAWISDFIAWYSFSRASSAVTEKPVVPCFCFAGAAPAALGAATNFLFFLFKRSVSDIYQGTSLILSAHCYRTGDCFHGLGEVV